MIIDGADEMLNMSFCDDMERILSYTDNPNQMIMFSATMSTGIKRIKSQYMNNPVTIQIVRGEVTAPGIEKYVVEVRDSVEKYLWELPTYCMIFILFNFPQSDLSWYF